MLPFPVPWRVVGFLAAILGGFAGGALWHKGICDRVAMRLREATEQAVAQQQDRNVAALTRQLQVNQAIGAENEKLKDSNRAADEHFRALLRGLSHGNTGSVSSTPAGSVSPPTSGEEPACTRVISELVERTASLGEAARSDATSLTLLQEWADKSGLMN